MLRNDNTYLEISAETGASTATISRVNRSLNYGNDGYDMVFNRMEDPKNTNEEDTEYKEPDSKGKDDAN